jgi:hypothetical protein
VASLTKSSQNLASDDHLKQCHAGTNPHEVTCPPTTLGDGKVATRKAGHPDFQLRTFGTIFLPFIKVILECLISKGITKQKYKTRQMLRDL